MRIKFAAVAFLFNVFVIFAASGRDYPVYQMGVKPEIDGRLDDAAWKGLPEAAGFFILGGQDYAWQKPTSFRIGWDSEALYLAVRCKEPFTHLLNPLFSSDGDMLWADDSIELFLSHDGKSYYQFIVNSTGARWNGKDGTAVAAIWNWKAGADIASDYWTAEIRIPFSVIGRSPREGDVWRFNIGRNLVLGPSAERFSCWAPLRQGFGEVSDFAGMLFMSAPADDEISVAEEKMNGAFHLFAREQKESLVTPVKNSFFEEGLQGWGLREPHRISVDHTTSTAGEQSIRLDGVLEPGESPIRVTASQSINLKPGTRYILRADIKRSKFAGGISLDVMERDLSDVPWKHHRIGDRLGESDVPGAWGRYETRFRTSEKLLQAAISLYNINSDAVVWYDNIQLFEDDGSAVEAGMPRAEKNLVVEVALRDAAAKVFVNGEAIPATANGPFSALIREGLNVIAVDAAAQGDNPGVRMTILGHPETGGRWLVSGEREPAADWTTSDYDDRGWAKPVEDAGGYIWAGSGGSERSLMRQVILWNKGHDGPDRVINPLIKEWGISEGSAETLFKAVYSPFAFPLAEYEFIFDIPGGFRLLDFMHETGRHALNTRPSGFVTEQVTHEGKSYTRYRIAFPEERMYTETGSIISRYLLLPVFLEDRSGNQDTTFWYYRREAKGNFTELQQKIPVRILPPIDGRMMENIMISQYCAWPWVSPHLSPEHLDRHLSQSFQAGLNTWILNRWNIDINPYLKTIHDRITTEKNGRLILGSNYPYHGSRERLYGGHPDTLQFLYRWLGETPQARARYWNDSDSWERRGQWCPTYALGEGREHFYREVLETYRLKLKGLPGASLIWSNYEEAPWAGSNIYTRPRDGNGSWCFCGLCKENFRRWADLPADADLSDEKIFSSYREKWHSFRSYLDGKIAEIPKRASNELGREYMLYSWMAHRDLWAALGGNIDRAFVGSPGNSAADGYQQRGIDRDASFLRDEAGFERCDVMGQRFSFQHKYAWRPEQDHKVFWRKWTVLSPSGYVEPKTWKSQVLRVVAAFGGGVDIQSSLEASGGMLYWIGEATRIMGEYEDIFHKGERADELAVCDKLAYPNVLVLKKGSERVVMLFNEGDEDIEVALENTELKIGQRAEIFETGVRVNNPAEMKVNVPAQDVAVVHIR